MTSLQSPRWDLRQLLIWQVIAFQSMHEAQLVSLLVKDLVERNVWKSVSEAFQKDLPKH